MKIRFKKRLLIVIISLLLSFALIIGACAIYLADYYPAEEGSIATFAPEDNISVSELDKGGIVFMPKDPKAGFIFYLGGKVEHNAYQTLMASLAREGVLCVLVKMPFNLAVFDINAADGFQDQYPEIEDWYIGGHSLGGSMAASYLEKSFEEYEGLVLLGSYSTVDLTNSGLDVLSVYGSVDYVLNSEKYADNRSNLPDDFTEIVIEGGCHSYFGTYGEQKGDGTPSISNQEQIELTVKSIMSMISEKSK